MHRCHRKAHNTCLHTPHTMHTQEEFTKMQCTAAKHMLCAHTTHNVTDTCHVEHYIYPDKTGTHYMYLYTHKNTNIAWHILYHMHTQETTYMLPTVYIHVYHAEHTYTNHMYMLHAHTFISCHMSTCHVHKTLHIIAHSQPVPTHFTCSYTMCRS